jgi:hypothetical protein
MNLFRSKENVRRRSGDDPTAAGGTLRIDEWAYVSAGSGSDARSRTAASALLLARRPLDLGAVVKALALDALPVPRSSPRLT